MTTDAQAIYAVPPTKGGFQAWQIRKSDKECIAVIMPQETPEETERFARLFVSVCQTGDVS